MLPSPGCRQAFRIQHLRTNTRIGERTAECADGLTSLAAERADAGDLNAMVRNHGSMENRRHSVQDFTDDEDRCRVRTGHTSRNLSAITHLAIAIFRHPGQFPYLPPANRDYAREPQAAGDAILHPLLPPR